MSISKAMQRMLGASFIAALSGCGGTQLPQSSVESESVLPRALAQARTLDTEGYQITLKIDGKSKRFTVTDNGGQLALELLYRVDNGTYTLEIDVETVIDGDTRPLYSYEGALTVSGDDTVELATTEFSWPDDDNDGFTNFIELDQRETDLDNDGATNDLDLDSDGDGEPDFSDISPFASHFLAEMVPVPAGCYQMGSVDERPVHQVCLHAFNIGKYELTADQYDTYTDAKGFSRTDIGYHFPSYGRENLSVSNVSWDDIQGYIAWLKLSTGRSFRLPSESEWEYAARAGSTTNFPWGDEIGVGNANCNGCGGEYDGYRSPIGSYSVNAFGLYDVIGGVGEWVEDQYYSNYDGAPNDGSSWIKTELATDLRVARGGGFGGFVGQYIYSSSTRGRVSTDFRDDSLGFRMAEDI